MLQVLGHIEKKSLIPNNFDLKINGFDFITDGYNYSKLQMYFLLLNYFMRLTFQTIQFHLSNAHFLLLSMLTYKFLYADFISKSNLY